MEPASNPDAAAQAALLEARLAAALKFLGHDVREGHSSTLALLELQRIKPDPMTMAELVERVERNARRSLAAIDDFMDLSRAQVDALALEETDLADLLVEVVADAWPIANREGVRIQVADGPEGATARVDRELLGGAIAKLLRDIIAKATRGSTVTCTLQCSPTGWSLGFEIDDPASASAPSAAGIDASSAAGHRQRRVDPGLALAEVVARRHGGTFRVDAGADQRRRFCLQFPASDLRLGTEP